MIVDLAAKIIYTVRPCELLSTNGNSLLEGNCQRSNGIRYADYIFLSLARRVVRPHLLHVVARL